jgi:hypothetical protein
MSFEESIDAVSGRRCWLHIEAAGLVRLMVMTSKLFSCSSSLIGIMASEMVPVRVKG